VPHRCDTEAQRKEQQELLICGLKRFGSAIHSLNQE
jgi:hypothetical protein